MCKDANRRTVGALSLAASILKNEVSTSPGLSLYQLIPTTRTESLPVLSNRCSVLYFGAEDDVALEHARDWKDYVQDDIEDAGEEKVCVEDDVDHAQGGFVLKFPTRCFPLLPVLDPPRPLPCSHNLQASPPSN